MLSSGEKLGRYEVVSPLGAGGMGEVYRARDTELQREVALQILCGVFQRPDRVKRSAGSEVPPRSRTGPYSRSST
jgi:serine/threonine protein kinase